MRRGRRPQPPDGWEQASPTTLRNMADTERSVAHTFARWADEHRRIADAYDDLADAKEARRLEEP